VAKRKYPKKRPPHAAIVLRAEGFELGFPKGLPSPYVKRDASLHRPCGLIRPNPPVLGATSGEENRRVGWARFLCPRGIKSLHEYCFVTAKPYL